jgi:hypothetical protein
MNIMNMLTHGQGRPFFMVSSKNRKNRKKMRKKTKIEWKYILVVSNIIMIIDELID